MYSAVLLPDPEYSGGLRSAFPYGRCNRCVHLADRAGFPFSKRHEAVLDSDTRLMCLYEKNK